MKKKSITWDKNLEEKKYVLSTRDENALKNYINQYDLINVASLLTKLDGSSLQSFFTQEVITKRGSHSNGWLKILALDVYRLSKNCMADGVNEYSANKYNSSAFKQILVKLLTLIDIEILTRDFINRHEFSELVKSDIRKVLTQHHFDESFVQETDSSSDDSFNDQEPETSSDKKTTVKIDDLCSQEIKDPSNNSISLLLRNAESTKTKSEDDSENDIPIIQNEFLFWLYSLPEKVLEYLLKLSSVQELITHFEAIQNILTIKTATDSFTELCNSSAEELHNSTWGNSHAAIQSAEVQISYDNSLTPEFYISPSEFTYSDIFYSQGILLAIPETLPSFAGSFLEGNHNMGMELLIR